MNKQELINAVADETQSTKVDVEKVLNSVLTQIVDAVVQGDRVVLVGFGTFEKSHRSARQGRNPQTREPIPIPATTVPKFSPGKRFKGLVSGVEEEEQQEEALAS